MKNTPFVEGLIDEILSELPFGVRIDLLLNWAVNFASETYIPDQAIIDIIATITTLDFRESMGLNEETFPNLIHLPFSSALANLDLSCTRIGTLGACMETLSHPIFRHLVTLNLHDTQLGHLGPLLNAPHPFPNLHTLTLSNNLHLSIPTIATTTQFPNLKVLNLSKNKLTLATITGFSATTPPYLLEKLFLSFSRDALSLSSSPHLTQLQELHLSYAWFGSDTIKQLFDPHTSVLKNLTHLHLDQINIKEDYSAFTVISQTPLLSNLVRLELTCCDAYADPFNTDINQQAMQPFINSPFLWTPQLKHLSLRSMPTDVNVFNDLIPVLNSANIQLQTLDLRSTCSSLVALSSAPCLFGLKEFKIGEFSEEDNLEAIETFLQSPILTNLEALPQEIIKKFTPTQLISLLSSPTMLNNLVEIDFSNYSYPLNDVIKTLWTQRTIPDDETSPLKFSKLRNINLSYAQITEDDVKLIIDNLPQLAHLDLGGFSSDEIITDAVMTALLSAERADPFCPSTSLPNLTYLRIAGSSISTEGFIELSKSQLLDQLEYLDVGNCESLCQDEEEEIESDLPPGLKALFTTPLVSHLRYLGIDGILANSSDEVAEYDESLFQHLAHCNVDQNW